MKSSIKIEACAKINLFLEILGIRPDGYHELRTILQSINLADDIKLTLLKNDIRIISNNNQIPLDKNNLAYKAAKLLQDISSANHGVEIELNKNIPIGAGLGGGSADAAAVLLGCNKLWNLKLSTEYLLGLATKIGMDISFLIEGGTALAVNRGEIIKEKLSTPKLYLILVYPNISVSTKQIYQLYDNKIYTNYRKCDNLLRGLRKENNASIIKNIYNRLEEICFEIHPELLNIKQLIIQSGAINAIMTGSGSAIYGIYQNYDETIRISAEIARKTDYWVKPVQTIDKSIIIK